MYYSIIVKIVNTFIWSKLFTSEHSKRYLFKFVTIFATWYWAQTPSLQCDVYITHQHLNCYTLCLIIWLQIQNKSNFYLKVWLYQYQYHVFIRLRYIQILLCVLPRVKLTKISSQVRLLGRRQGEAWKLKIENWRYLLNSSCRVGGSGELENWKLKIENWKLKIENWNLKIELNF